MKSKILLDLDENGQPIIRIEYTYSEDVRDKLVSQFLSGFGTESVIASFNFVSTDPNTEVNKVAHIKPIHAFNFEVLGQSYELTKTESKKNTK